MINDKRNLVEYVHWKRQAAVNPSPYAARVSYSSWHVTADTS